jgi:hypothetical protein
MFLKWLGRYSALNKFELTKGRDHKGRYFIIETGTKEIESDDMPF